MKSNQRIISLFLLIALIHSSLVWTVSGSSSSSRSELVQQQQQQQQQFLVDNDNEKRQLGTYVQCLVCGNDDAQD
jgi:hypothetical protein